MSGIERIGGKLVYSGPIASVRIDEFRHPDGTKSMRQVVVHPGAVAILAHDSRILHMVRQPREAVGEAALLEIPAGKLDVEGESPLEAAQRELAEEVGKAAGDWEHLKTFYPTPGFASEKVHLFRATELYDVPRSPADEERIEMLEVPLAELDGVITECRDAKSLIGLMLLQRLLHP